MEKATARKQNPKAPKAAPPERDPSLGYGLRRSLFIHAALITFVILKSIFFPSSDKPYTPALRVDVVDLPDLLKMEKMKIGSLPEPEPSAKEDAQAPESKKEAEPPPVNDEMVLAKKKAEEEARKKKEEERRKREQERIAKQREKRRKQNMSSALAKIKALNKVTEAPMEAPDQFKGNKESKGSAIDGDARETHEPTYFDLVHQRIKNNWELPVWLDRMQLSAKVRVTIDGRGHVRSMNFAKVSGNAQFDQAVKDAISKSQPFPAPPKEQAGAMISSGILLGFPL